MKVTRIYKPTGRKGVVKKEHKIQFTPFSAQVTLRVVRRYDNITSSGNEI
jgi:hypothetical protein